jgi:hypothetical protein
MASYEVCDDYVNQGPPYKEGYSFFLKRLTAQYNDSQSVMAQAYLYKYEGTFTISKSSDTDVTNAYDGYTPTAATYGAQAFKRFRPVQPRAGLGQALGELKDFPSLFKVALKRFCDLGSLYLNYQFGWRPFIKDLLDVINLQKKVENHIRFVRNHNGKWIKRQGTLRDTTETTNTHNLNLIIPALSSYLLYPVGSPSKVERTLIVKDKIWFEGVMKYYIPKLEVDSAKNMWSSPLLRKLYGLEITPSLLWKLTPWTWLTDWFVNVGDIHENFTNQGYDNLVTKYAYVMRTRSTSAVYAGTKPLRMSELICSGGKIIGYQPAYPGPVPACSVAFTAECKERARAFWWGVGNSDGSSLTERQLAILLALGIQQAR